MKQVSGREKIRNARQSASKVRGSAAGGIRVPFSASLNETLSQRVYSAFKKDIITDMYQPADVLGEKELAMRYQSSRTPVREAAVRLQQEHFLRIIPNRGYFIAQITIQWVNEVYDFRAAVEGASAELAAQANWDRAAIANLRQLAETEHQVDDRAGHLRFIEADTELHIEIAQLTRNQLLIKAVSDMRSQMERIMYASIDAGYYGEVPVREHCDIVDAIQNRDPSLARKLMCEHIYVSKNKVLRMTAANSGV